MKDNHEFILQSLSKIYYALLNNKGYRLVNPFLENLDHSFWSA